MQRAAINGKSWLAALGFSLAVCARAAETLPAQSWPGIFLHSETQTNPPQHLFIAEVDLTNPQVRVRVAPGGPDPDGPGRWQTTLMQPTRVAAREHFDLVVNGDFFDAQAIKDAEGTNSRYRTNVWAATVGPAMTDGMAWASGTNERPCLVVHKDHSLAIEKLERPSSNDWEVVSGNTMLLENGTVVPHANKLRHPRTCVGLDAKHARLIILVVDGRKPGVCTGMTYDELAATMLRLGCDEALNLDGGGSSVMAVRDAATGEHDILNQPSDGHERPVANVLGISVATPRQAASAAH